MTRCAMAALADARTRSGTETVVSSSKTIAVGRGAVAAQVSAPDDTNSVARPAITRSAANDPFRRRASCSGLAASVPIARTNADAQLLLHDTYDPPVPVSSGTL